MAVSPSPSSYRNQRVGIFIDVQNLYHSAKHLFQGRVNYAELIKHVVGERQPVRMLGYVVKSATAEGEAQFFEALEKVGIELRSKDLQIFGDGSKKADWDVGLAVDAIRMATRLEAVVLVTGDGDFVPLVEYLKWNAGCTVEVAAFKRSASIKLQEAADRFIDLAEIPRLIIRSARAATARRYTNPT
ncbi:MAG: NYN domain-containing protein [Candidatus Liptonbacteria bacterium]|nr:NYN domain-containing protein [Candidatus Liptonbacteria bacterium]